MHFNFTVKSRFSKRNFFNFSADRIEIFKPDAKFLFYLSRFICFSQKHVIKRKAYNYRIKQSIISIIWAIICELGDNLRNGYNLRKVEADSSTSF